MRAETIAKIDENRLIAIVRGVEPEKCLQVAEALYAGGIRLMEITFDQKAPASFRATADAIAAVGKAFEGRMLVGAGTVITPELAELASSAGARFIISPDANPDVIRRTVELGMVSIPGCMTPTEMLTANRAGADYIKLFPAGDLGPGYVKAVRAPLSHLKVMAVGGVNEKNIADFVKAGVCGFGVGGNLVNKTWIAEGAYDKLTEAARSMVNALKV